MSMRPIWGYKRSLASERTTETEQTLNIRISKHFQSKQLRTNMKAEAYTEFVACPDKKLFEEFSMMPLDKSVFVHS